MAQNLKNFNEVLSFSRGTGATRVNAAGLIVGVDFSSTSNTIGTGSKTFTLIADANVNRDWSVGENVLVVSQAGATGSMTGVVTSYTPSTQALVVNVTSTTGSGTSTDWRVGSLEVRRGADGLVVENTPITVNTVSLTETLTGVTASAFGQTGFGGIKNATTYTETATSGGHEFRVRSQNIGASSGSIFYFVYAFKASANVSFVNINTVFSNALINLTALSVDSFSGLGVTSLLASHIYRTSDGFTFVVLKIQYQATANDANANIQFLNDQRQNSYLGDTSRSITSCPMTFYQGNADTLLANRTVLPVWFSSWTRNADTITFSNSSLQQFRQSQGTIYVDADFPVTTTRAAALSLTGTNSEISLARQSIGTTASFTKMVESGNTQVFGSSTAGNLFKNLGKGYELAQGTRNDRGTTNTNLALVFASLAVASSGNGFGISAAQVELTTDGNLSSVTVRGVGSDVLTGAHWTGSRFIVANGSEGHRLAISLDGTSYRVVNSPIVTSPCNEVTSGLVGGITRVVMVGNGGAIFTSDDQGETWTARTSGTAQILNAVTFGNSRFVAIGNNNAAVTSTDGITWAAATGLTGTLTDIIHTGSQFVAINTVGGVFTSTDGITFTAATVSGISPAFTSAQGIAYDNGFYTIVGNGGQVVIAQAAANATSFTFSTFVAAQTGTSLPFGEVIAFGGQFYAVAGIGGALSTVIRFTQSLTPTFNSSTINASTGLAGIAASTNTILVSGSLGGILSSTDGTTFTSRTNNNQTLNGIAFGNNRFVSVGNAANGSGYIATIDADGTVTRRVSGTTVGFSGCRFVNGIFYALSNVGATHIRYSSDGVAWLTPNVSAAIVSYDIAFGNGFFVIVGQGNGIASFAYSADGVNFTTVTLVGTVNLGSNNPSIAFGNGIFVAVGRVGLIYTATNPTAAGNWIQRTSNTNQDLTSVMYSTRDNCWYAAGANGTLLRSDDNAVTWYSVNGAMQGYVLNNTLQANALSPGNPTGRNRFALSYANNSIKVASNGNVVTTDTAASLGSITAVTLGENFNGTIRNIRLFPQARTDSELIQISLGATTPGINDTLAVNAAGDTLQVNAAGDTFRIN